MPRSGGAADPERGVRSDRAQAFGELPVTADRMRGIGEPAAGHREDESGVAQGDEIRRESREVGRAVAAASVESRGAGRGRPRARSAACSPAAKVRTRSALAGRSSVLPARARWRGASSRASAAPCRAATGASVASFASSAASAAGTSSTSTRTSFAAFRSARAAARRRRCAGAGGQGDDDPWGLARPGGPGRADWQQRGLAALVGEGIDAVGFSPSRAASGQRHRLLAARRAPPGSRAPSPR